VLIKIKKGASPEGTLEAAQKITSAGMLLSQMVLLGIGGIDMSEIHAVDTGKLLSAMSPDYAAALTVMILPETELGRDAALGKFMLPDKMGIIRELRLIIENMHVKRDCFFTSNHASNYLPIRAHFPREQEKVLTFIDQVLAQGGGDALRPEAFRAL
jgi:hypothetical protein